MRVTIIFAIIIFVLPDIKGQIIDSQTYNADSIRSEFDKRPYFGLMKDNYFAFGSSTFYKPTSDNSIIKIQLSISQRLTKSKLPFDSYLFIAHTQKINWNIFKSSAPINELYFNPAIGLSRLLIKENKYIGKSTLMVEHESNGKDGVNSRSLEKLTLATSLLLRRNLELQVKIWIPYIDGENNQDILKYTGIFQVGSDYKMLTDKLRMSAIITKRSGWGLNFNTAFELSYKHSQKSNQFFFIQYYNGYGESLTEYKTFSNSIRVGFVIKPTDFSFY